MKHHGILLVLAAVVAFTPFPLCAGGRIDLSAGGQSANCYIVNREGQYSIPLTVGDSPVSGAVRTRVIWEDGLHVDEASLSSDGKALEFDIASFSLGNALVGVTDADGIILWSWHIWATEYSPGVGDIDVKSVRGIHYKVMPLNLGSGKIGSTHCCLYQFGRKDPFPNTSDAAHTDTDGTLERSIREPDVFFLYYPSGKSQCDWCDTCRYDWWAGGVSGGNTSYLDPLKADTFGDTYKTIYDPCPAGYRVACDDVFTSFTEDSAYNYEQRYFNVKGDWHDGWDFYTQGWKTGPTINFPATGWLYGDDGVLLEFPKTGFYWSAFPYSIYGGRCMNLGKDVVNPLFNFSLYRGYGYAVRCVCAK